MAVFSRRDEDGGMRYVPRASVVLNKRTIGKIIYYQGPQVLPGESEVSIYQLDKYLMAY